MMACVRESTPGDAIKEAGTAMFSEARNKYRNAVEILQRGRDVLVEELTKEILDREEELVEGGYLLNEFLEAQGTRLHFLCLLVGQLEQSAEALDETRRPLPAVPAAK